VTTLSLSLPCRFLRGGWTKLALTVIALACGVALVCAIDLVNRAVLRAFVEVVDTMAGRAALQVTAGEGGLFRETVAESVAAVPGVELAVPVVSATAFTADESGELLTVQGIDVTNDDAVRVYEARDAGAEVEDPLVFLSQPDSVILTRTFAGRRGLRIGSRIVLVTPAGHRPFTVRALLEPEGVARIYGGNLVVMDLFAAEAAFARPGFINRLDVVVRHERDVAEVKGAIAAVLPPGLSVEAPAQRKTDIHRIMGSLQVLLRGMALVGLVASFLITFNRLSTAFEARMWQLGMLRAVGARTALVWRELLKESLLLGAAGVLVGIPAGVGLGYLLLPVVAATTALNSKLVAPEAELALSGVSVALAAGLGLAAALLAAALPARRAAGAALAETIRCRGVEQPAGRGRVVWALRALVAAGVVAAVWMQSATRTAAWGLAATGLIAVGTALVAQPFLRAVQPLVALLQYLPRASGRLAAKTLLRNPRRAALTVGMLGVGIGSVVWLWTVAHSFESSVIATLSRAFRADLILSSSHIASGFDDAPTDARLLEEVAPLEGVEAVAGERILDWHHAGGPISIDAFDPAYFSRADFGRWPLYGDAVAGIWEAVARGEAVIISTNFVHSLGTRVGHRIVLDTPSGPLPLLVGGVTSAFASSRGTIEMSRELYRRYWHDDQVTRVHLRVRPGSDLAGLRAAIARQLGDRYRLRMLSSGELMVYWTEQVHRAFGALHVVAAVVLLVILIGMADTLAAGIVERTRELGTLRAVGGRRGRVRRMVLAEGLLLGALGLVLAVVAGLAMGTLWVQATFPLLLGWVLQLHIPYREVLAIGVTTLVVCVVAAVLPAREAARLEPAVALREE
jgi:putative ABC transport system permease protein